MIKLGYNWRRNKLLFGDCLHLLPSIPTNSVDLICADLPYGETAHKLDKFISPEKLWPEYWRILKPDGAIVLFGQGRFSAMMINSSKYYRYTRIWNKLLSTGFLNVNRQPLRIHEDVTVFYKKAPTYNPQMTKGRPSNSKGAMQRNKNNNYNAFTIIDNSKAQGGLKYPTSIISIQKPHPSKSIHRTQKPVALIEDIILTYSNEGETVLDNTTGSGTLGEASINTGRYFILMEKCPIEFAKMKRRIDKLYKDRGWTSGLRWLIFKILKAI